MFFYKGWSVFLSRGLGRSYVQIEKAIYSLKKNKKFKKKAIYNWKSYLQFEKIKSKSYVQWEKNKKLRH